MSAEAQFLPARALLKKQEGAEQQQKDDTDYEWNDDLQGGIAWHFSPHIVA